MLDTVIFSYIWTTQFGHVNTLDEVLALLETRADLVWQPCCDWSTTCCARVLGVVDDVLLDHVPVLMSEPKACVDVAKHQERRVAVFQRKIFELSVKELLAAIINVVLMVEWPVLPQLEKVLSKCVAWVFKAESTVQRRDNTVLGATLTSELELLVTNSLIQNTAGEDIIISLNSHDVTSEVKVIFGV